MLPRQEAGAGLLAQAAPQESAPLEKRHGHQGDQQHRKVTMRMLPLSRGAAQVHPTVLQLAPQVMLALQQVLPVLVPQLASPVQARPTPRGCHGA